jgi:two-component system, HptB-dependent secretion and biofilm response regulator
MQLDREELTRYSSKLTLLCVEDDDLYLEMLNRICRPCFAQVLTARNGMEALELVRRSRPDLILVDNLMPVMSGLQMIRELRDMGDRIPLVLMTASIDNAILAEAIDLGVSKFLPKPLSVEALFSAFRSMTQEIVSERERRSSQSQELQQLRYRDQYHFQQQEIASRKEEHLLRNDLRRTTLCCGSGEEASRWFVDLGYRPQHVLCGDGFMVRNIAGGNVLICIIDAMGSGLSAAMTAMCATAYLNHLCTLQQRERRYHFRRLVELFLEFCHTVLLPEEVLSCGFLEIDCAGNRLDAALFALPPLQLLYEDGSLGKLKGANPPISHSTTGFRSQEFDLTGVAGLLLTTDGLTDAELAGEGSYREHLQEDFGNTLFARDLEQRFLNRIADCFDDVTFIRLSRIDCGLSFRESLALSARLDEVGRAVAQLERYLREVAGAGSDCLGEAVTAATEALMNAFEHGCLGLSEQGKAQLLAAGSYDGFIASARGGEEAIRLELALKSVGAESFLVLTVSDSGDGFDLSRLDAKVSERRLCGRGLRLIRKYSDGVWYNRQGNSVCLMKRIY